MKKSSRQTTATPSTVDPGEAAKAKAFGLRMRQSMTETMQRRAQERAMEKLSDALKNPARPVTQTAPPSGTILPGVELVPIQDLAARWKVSIEQIHQQVNNGRFQIVVHNAGSYLDYWHIDRSLWRHEGKTFISPSRGVVHTLVSLPVIALHNPPPLLFRSEEVKKIEQEEEYPEANNSETLLSKKEAAGVCGVDPRTINNWMKEGRLAPSKTTPSGSLRFRRDDVLKASKKPARQ